MRTLLDPRLLAIASSARPESYRRPGRAYYCSRRIVIRSV